MDTIVIEMRINHKSIVKFIIFFSCLILSKNQVFSASNLDDPKRFRLIDPNAFCAVATPRLATNLDTLARGRSLVTIVDISEDPYHLLAAPIGLEKGDNPTIVDGERRDFWESPDGKRNLTEAYRAELGLATSINPYMHTEPTFKRENDASQKKQRVTTVPGINEPFGPTFDGENTTIRTVGHPSMVKAISVEFFRSPFDKKPYSTMPLSREGSDSVQWSVKIPGNIEGRWYRLAYTRGEVKTTMYGANDPEIPEKWTTPDPFARQQSALNGGFSRISYPLDKSEMTATPDIPLGGVTLLDQLEDFGIEEIKGSKEMQAILSTVHAFEPTPIVSSSLFQSWPDGKGNRVVWPQYLQYAPVSWAAISTRLGGPDAMQGFIEYLRTMKVGFVYDFVFNHFSNMYTWLKYVMPEPYLNTNNPDFNNQSGCGHTVKYYEPVMRKMAEQAVVMARLLGITGARFDLAGASPREFMVRIFDYLKAHGVDISAEGWSARYHNSYWSMTHEVIRGAGLWLNAFRDNIPIFAQRPTHRDILMTYLVGGSKYNLRNPDGSDTGFRRESASDGTALLSSHDTDPLLSRMGKNSYLREHKASFAMYLLLATQGRKIVAKYDILGADTGKQMRETPIPVAQLFKERHKAFDRSVTLDSHSDIRDRRTRFDLDYLAFNKKFVGYFSYEALDEHNSLNSISNPDLINSNGNNKALGILIKRPAIGENYGELLLLANTDEVDVEFTIPEGSWDVMVSSGDFLATDDVNKPLFWPAKSGKYRVAKHSGVMLVKRIAAN